MPVMVILPWSVGAATSHDSGGMMMVSSSASITWGFQGGVAVTAAGFRRAWEPRVDMRSEK